MKINKIFLCLCLIFCVNFSSYSDNTNDITTSLNIIEVLNYGIEEEVTNLLKNLPTTLKKEIYELLLERYKTALITETKIKLIDFFSRCKNLPEFVIDYLYEEAKKEPSDIRLFSSLLSFLGSQGKKREGSFLIRMLDSDNKKIAISAADALTKLEDKELITSVLERLKLSDTSEDKVLNDEIKSKLILFLAKTQAIEAKEYLREKLIDNLSTKYVIAYSMYALSKINDVDSIKLIEKKLSDPDAIIQEYAAYAISEIKSNEVISILKNMLRHNNEKVRIYACKGISNYKTEDNGKILLYKYKNDPSVNVKKEALKALILLGEVGISLLKKENLKFSPKELFVISETVAYNTEDSTVNFLIELYEKGNDEEKENIAKGLVGIKDKRIDPLIKKMLYSNNLSLRIGALKLISGINDSSLWEDVKNISKNDPNEGIRKAASHYLELR